MATEQGTTVAKVDRTSRIYDGLVKQNDPFEVRRRAYEIASSAAQDAMVAKMQRQVAATTWGKALPNPELQKAFCSWALNKGIDPAIHVDILGGNIYLNAQYYEDRLTAHPGYKHSRTKVVAPVSMREFPEKVFGTKEIEKLKKFERKVNMERYEIQIVKNIPAAINNFPDTSAAVLVEIEMKDGCVFEAWGKAGSYGRKSPRNPSRGVDPVGDGAPIETATTRAYRKCCKKLPGWSDYIGDKDEELLTVQEAVEEARQERKQREAEPVETSRDVIGDMQVEIDDLLGREDIDHDLAASACHIYEDWVAGGFEGVSVEQVSQLLNELREGMEDGLYPRHFPMKAVEDVVDGKTGEVIEEHGRCAMCNASLDMGEPHGSDCPMVQPPSEEDAP